MMEAPGLTLAASLSGRPSAARLTCSRIPLFVGLAEDEWSALEPIFSTRVYGKGETVVREGDADPSLYIVQKGRARVVKTSGDRETDHGLATINVGETIGEMKLAIDEPSSATVVALETLTLLVLDRQMLKAERYAGVRARIAQNLCAVLTSRLRTNNDTAVAAMQSELVQSRARLSAGRLLVNLFGIVSAYTLFVASLNHLPPAARPTQTLLSAFVILLGALPIWRMIRASPYPLAAYGLGRASAGRVAGRAFLWSLPLLAFLTLLKWVWIRLDPELASEPLFHPAALFAGEPFRPLTYGLGIAAYVLLSPVQELFVRSGMQASLAKILPSQPGPSWLAIVLSNLFFASAHTFIGFGFAVATFLPGLFWGWMFDRQRSLLGPSLSHALVGVYALFVLGVQPIIGGH